MSRYVPKPDAEGINSTTASPLRDVALLLGGFVVTVLIAYVVLGGLGEWLLTRVRPETETRWLGRVGFAFADGAESADLTALVERLNAGSSLPLRAVILCHSSANALALPGGTIQVTSGLLSTVESENGLAFVLGHEIGHFVHRDHLRGFGRRLLVAMGWSLFGSDGGAAAASLGAVLDQRYDRQAEAAADSYALDLLERVYGHAWGADELFEFLSAEEAGVSGWLESLASRHPASQARLAAVRARQVGAPVAPASPARPFAAWLAEAGCPR